ncbi:hypothetical protein [Nostoc sp.]|uniref:hypothetical protein n=1 Tax=Nostoc sp. TaxID=1180 RepID=UPI002FF58C42
MADLNNSGTANSSTGGENLLKDSPWGRLSEVMSDKDLGNIFSGVGKGESSGSPFGGSGSASASASKPDLAYGGNPFAGDNFWNIFAGGKNPSAGAGNQGSTTDPLTGVGSQGGSISTTEIPDGFGLRVTIDNLVNSKLKEEQGGSVIPSSGGGMPSFGGGGAGGGMPSFGGSGAGGGMPSFGGSGAGGGMPSFGGGGASGEIPSFGGGSAGGGMPSFGGGSAGGGMPSFGGGSAGGGIPFP